LLAATELPLRQSRNALVAQGELRGVAVPVLKKAHCAESADGNKKT
jgi:hypothetical protein